MVLQIRGAVVKMTVLTFSVEQPVAKGLDSLSASILSFIVVSGVFAGAIVVATKATPPKRVKQVPEQEEVDEYSSESMGAFKQPEAPASNLDESSEAQKKN